MVKTFILKQFIKKTIPGFIVLSFILLIWSNYTIYKVSKPFLYTDISAVQPVKTALLPGTSRYLSNGNTNAYFFNRIEACVKLYQHGKISYVLISGDNSRKNYNEPLAMKEELVKRGIPETKIVLDYAGFDTYDSALRASEIFGQEEYIIVSQKFQNQRAIYIARKNGIRAFGYNAEDVHKMGGIKTKIREYFACVKAFLEVKFHVKPHFLGKKEPF